jgi:hypothetical protein
MWNAGYVKDNYLPCTKLKVCLDDWSKKKEQFKAEGLEYVIIVN